MKSPCDKRPSKRTKIVATLGPASQDVDVLRRMIMAGLDVVRLNFSHGDYAAHAALIRSVRQLSDELDVPIAILGDLRGPRIRVGEIEGGTITLEPGATVVLTPEPVVGTAQRVSISFPGLAGDLKTGDRLLVDDGDVELRVEKLDAGGAIHCHVEEGGTLSSRRGINLPGIRVSLPSVTDKDERDVAFAVEQKIDYLALSFVQSASDVRGLKQRLAALGADIPVIAKIEKKGALDDIDAIVEEAYGVMVARGDLALEMSFEEVPVAQKRIIAKCRAAAVPVITATQMLESMMEHPRPTRAEVSDVANALFDGTDATMLSGETAAGRYPTASVEAMVRIAAEIERSAAYAKGPNYDVPVAGHLRQGATPTGHAVAAAAVEAVHRLGAPALVTFTRSGSTSRLVSSYRPPVPILAITDQERTYRQLALVWGVRPVRYTGGEVSYDTLLSCACEHLLAEGIATAGQPVVVTAGVPFRGTTNMLRVEVV
jgi:pyruvate kinase